LSLLCLVALGAVAARIGGAPMLVGAARVTMWGVVAMLATAAVGRVLARQCREQGPAPGTVGKLQEHCACEVPYAS